MEFKLKVKDIGEDGRVTTIGEKVLYNLDGQTDACEWMRLPNKGKETFDAPQMTSAINIKSSGIGNLPADALGGFYNHST